MFFNFYQKIQTSFFLLILTVVLANGQNYQTFDASTTNAWTASKWSASSTTNACNASGMTNAFTSGRIAYFCTANGTGSGSVGITIGGIIANESYTHSTPSGTLLTGGNVVSINVASGKTLNLGSAAISTAAGTGFIKNGPGAYSSGGGAFTGGFTVNSGTMLLAGVNAMGAGGALTLNGGTVAGTATRDLTGKYSGGITFGGNIQFGEMSTVVTLANSTANLTFSDNVSLGSANRTLTLGNGGTMTFSGIISNSGSNGITFTANANGTGRFDITNTANTFSGPININGDGLSGIGEVRFAADGSLGNTGNTININGGRLACVSGSSFTLTSGRGIQVGNTANTSISVPGSGTLTFNGVIADLSGATPGAWSKQGGGTLQLGGISTYTGNTTISNGILQLTTGNDRLPVTTILSLGQAASTNLGTFDLNGRNQTIAGLSSVTGTNASTTVWNTVTSSTAATLTINSSINTQYSDGTAANSGRITGALSLVKSGNGTQTLGDVTNNTYTGTTTINGGFIAISGEAAFGANPASFTATQITLNGGGIKTISGSSLTFNSNRGITLGASGGTFDCTGSEQITLTNVVAGTGQLTKTGTGTLILNGNHSYTGGTLVTAGTLNLNSGGTLGATSGNLTINNNGTTANLTISATIGGLAGTGNSTLNLSPSGVTLVDNQTSNTTFAGDITGGGTFTKQGNGTLTLTGTNSGTGSVNVQGGSLLVNGSYSTGGGTVQVTGGVLGGTGTIKKNINIQSGGTITGGTNGGVGKLNIDNSTLSSMDWQGGGKYRIDISNVSASVAGTDFDQIALTGNLFVSASSGSPFLIEVAGNPSGWNAASSYTWPIAVANGGITSFSATSFSVNTSNFAATISGTFTVAQSGNNFNLIYTPTAIPVINLSQTSLSGFNYTFGSGPSAEQTFTVSGSNLVANISLAAPTNYEISTTSGSGYGASLNLTQSGGSLTGQPITIFVRLKAGLSIASYNSETITAASTNATNQTVTCNGSVTSQPSISLTPGSLSSFNYVVGNGPSSEQTFTVSGSNLTANIVLTAPTNYQISTNSGTGFGTSVSLTQSGGSLTGQPVTVYVRLKSGLAVGNYNSEVITATSTNATNQTLTCNGSVSNLPTISLSAASLTGFSYVVGNGPSSTQSFTVSGSNLTGNVTITASSNFEVSTSAGSGFGASVSLTNAGGAISGQPITIYARLKAGLAVGTYASDVITASSTFATNQTITCSGDVTNSPFSLGNLAIFLAGSSSLNNTTASVVEINRTTAGQSAINTFSIPSTGSNALRFSGTATSTGYLSLSNDGSLLSFTGGNTSNSANNINTYPTRGLGTLNNAGIFTLQTTYTGSSGQQTRSATSLNNATWFIGDQSGLYTNLSTSPSDATNLRALKAFGSSVYGLNSTTSANPIFTYSSANATSITSIFGSNTMSVAPFDFYLLQSGINGSAYDVAYFVGSTNATTGTIYKYSLVGGTWTANGSYSTSFGGFAITAIKNGVGADLFVTSGTGASGANNVVKLTDVAAYNKTISITTGNNVTLFTAGSGTTAKGISLAPIQTNAPSIAVSSTYLSGLDYILGNGPSAEQTFTVSGSNLTNIVSLSVSSNYEISTTSGSGFGSSVTLNQSGGSLSGQPVSIYVRLKAGLAVGTYDYATASTSDIISISSAGAYPAFVSLSGNVTPPNTVVQLTATSSTVVENAGSVTITASITNPSPTVATTVQLALTGGTGTSADINTYSTQTITFPANSSSSQSVTVTLTNDALVENLETFVFTLQNISGGQGTATLGVNTTYTLSIQDNDIPSIVINEIHYNPSDASGSTDAAFEFVELYNNGAGTVDVSEYSVSDAFVYTIPNGTTIASGQYLVLAVNSSTYSGSLQWTSGALNNSGETITLKTATANGGLTVDAVTYGTSSPWPTGPNGNGPSLALNSPGLDNAIGSNWSASCQQDGTPGAANSLPCPTVSTYYSRGSGTAATASIWSTTATGGTVGTIASLGGFSTTVDVVIQNGHTVDFASSADMKDLTVQSGATLRRNSTSASSMAYLNIYGSTVTIDGSVGNGSTFDAIGLNVEGTTVSLQGSGSINFGRIRKSNTANSTSTLTINSNTSLLFNGTALYNNAATTFNVNLPAGKTLNIPNGSVCIDGINGITTTSERGGTFTFAGTVNIGDSLMVSTDNATETATFTIPSGGTVNAGQVFTDLSNPRSVITVSSGGSLNISKALVLRSGTFSPSGNVRLLSSAAGTAYLDNFSSGNTGTYGASNVLTVERYVPGSSSFHYLSSPVDNAFISDWADDFSVTGQDGFVNTGTAYTNPWPTVWYYDETNTNASMAYGWISYTNTSSPFSRMTGYACILGGTTIEVSGQVNQTPSLTKTITKTTSAQPLSDGWNLLGNPYPSPLDWDLVYGLNSANVSSYVYYWSAATNNYATYNNATGLTTNGGVDKIASSQAFFIKKTATGSGTFTLNNTAKAADIGTSFFKTETQVPVIKLSLQKDQYEDELLVYQHDQAENGLDEQSDVAEWESPHPGVPSFYTLQSGEKLSNEGFSAIKPGLIIPLGVEKTSGLHQMKVNQLQQLAYAVYLEDNKLQTSTLLKEGDTIWMDIAQDNSDRNRFSLRIGEQTSTSFQSDLSLWLHSEEENQYVYVRGNRNQTADLEIWNMNGQSLMAETAEIVNEKVLVITSDLSAGIYLLKVNVDEQTRWFKFIK